jgi:hypothetical protein
MHASRVSASFRQGMTTESSMFDDSADICLQSIPARQPIQAAC